MTLERKPEMTLHDLVMNLWSKPLTKDSDIQPFMTTCNNSPELFLGLFQYGYGIPSFYDIAMLAITKNSPTIFLEVCRFSKTLVERGILKKELAEKTMQVKPPNNAPGILHLAATIGNREAFEFCLAYSDKDELYGECTNPNLTDQITVAGMAAKYNHIDILKCLLDHGININTPSSTGHTPLHRFNPHTHMNLTTAKFLLEHGADVNAEATYNNRMLSSLGMFWRFLNYTSVTKYALQAILLLEHDATLTFLEPQQIARLRKIFTPAEINAHSNSSALLYLQGLIEEKLVENPEFTAKAVQSIYMDTLTSCKTIDSLWICIKVIRHCQQNDAFKHIVQAAYHQSAILLAKNLSEFKPSNIRFHETTKLSYSGSEPPILITGDITLNNAVMLAHGMMLEAIQGQPSEHCVFLELMNAILRALTHFEIDSFARNELTLENRIKLVDLIPHLLLIPAHEKIILIPKAIVNQIRNNLFFSILSNLPEQQSTELLLRFLTEKATATKITIPDNTTNLFGNDNELETFAHTMADECETQSNSMMHEWREIATRLSLEKEKKKKSEITPSPAVSVDGILSLDAEVPSPSTLHLQSTSGLFGQSCVVESDDKNDIRSQLDAPFASLKRWCAASSSVGESDFDKKIKTVHDKMESFMNNSITIQTLHADMETILEGEKELPDFVEEIRRLINDYAISDPSVKRPRTLAALTS